MIILNKSKDPSLFDKDGKRIAFPCNGQRPCYGDINCGLVHKLGQCKHTLDPKFAAIKGASR